jgi:hypothetical protein
MNWLIASTGALFVIGSLTWVLNARYHFKGPKRMVEVDDDMDIGSSGSDKRMTSKSRISDDDNNSEMSDANSVSDTNSDTGNPPLQYKEARSNRNQDELIKAKLEHMSVNLRILEPVHADEHNNLN